jgi:hypothetical protein
VASDAGVGKFRADPGWRDSEGGPEGIVVFFIREVTALVLGPGGGLLHSPNKNSLWTLRPREYDVAEVKNGGISGPRSYN